MSTTAEPTIPVAAKTHGVWRRRVAFATAAALIAGAIGWFTFAGAPFTGRIVLQTRSYRPIAAPASGTDDDRAHMQVELLLRRSFFERLVAEPAIAALPSIREHSYPVNHLEANLQVKVVERARVEISLPGGNADDLTAILDLLAKMHIEDATSTERADRNEALRKMEIIAELLRGEIRAKERAINMMIEAIPAPVKPDEVDKLSSDIRSTEKELKELDLRINHEKSAEAIESLKEKRDVAAALLATRKQFRDLFEKGARMAERDRVNIGKNIEGLKEGLIAQQESINALNTRQVDLKIERDLGGSIFIGEPATAIRNADFRQRTLRSTMFFAAAFVAAFLLGFGLFRPGAK